VKFFGGMILNIAEKNLISAKKKLAKWHDL